MVDYVLHLQKVLLRGTSNHSLNPSNIKELPYPREIFDIGGQGKEVVTIALSMVFVQIALHINEMGLEGFNSQEVEA
jgi:hypothetical protein